MGVRAGGPRPRARQGGGAIAVLSSPVVALPATPFRGIDPFRYADHAIFFAREEETRQLSNLVAVYRGVLLYGESGAGKSSLINAGLLPRTNELGFHAERVRVQPRAHEELVVERIMADEDTRTLLPSLLAAADDRSPRVVLSTETFEQRVRAACASHRLLIVFDQFEEILTLFEEAGERDAPQRIVALLVRLLRDPLPVKLLISFREDYLGKVKELLHSCPELVDQSLRLAPPSADALPAIIRGPFERYPGHFDHELTPELSERLRDALDERFGSGDVSLSEVETVCLRLWQSRDPERLLSTRGLRGLLEDYLGEALDALPADLRIAAIAVLSQMVTAAGTRNVISAEDLVQRVHAEDRGLPEPLLKEALERLERESRLVRRERRRDLYLYEITSEFIVPWISKQRADLRRQHERRRDRRRLMLLGLAVVVLVAVATAVTILAIAVNHQRREAREQAARAEQQADIAERNTLEAERQATAAETLGLTMAAQAQRTAAPHLPLLLALAAYDRSPRPEARSALFDALLRARQSGVEGILHGHTGIAYGVALSPDGHTIASAGEDKTVRLWDLRTRRQVALLRGHRGIVGSVAFSPDGRTLASADIDQRILLWDVRSRTSRGELQGRGVPVLNSLAFTANGRQLLFANGNGTIRRWSVRSRRLVGRSEAGRRHTYGFAVAFSPDGRLFVSAGEGRRIALWDTRRGRPHPGRPLAVHVGEVSAVAFSPDGRTLAVGGRKQQIELFDVRSHQPLGRPFKVHTRQIYGLAFTSDGQAIAAPDTDKTIRFWGVGDRSPLGPPLKVHSGRVFALAAGPRGGSVISTSADSTIAISNFHQAERFGRPLVSSRSLYGATTLSQTVAAAQGARRIRLWDLRTGKPLPRLPKGDIGYSASLALSRDGRTLAAARGNGRIRVWDVAGRRLVRRLRSHSRYPSLTLSDDGRRLAAVGMSGKVRVWDLPGGASHTPLRMRARGVQALALSPDGDMLAIAGRAGRVHVWDVRRGIELGQPLRTQPTSYVSELKFSPDGHMLASVGASGTIALWDAARRRPLSGLVTGQLEGVTTVAFAPDGNTLAVGGYNSRVRLWNLHDRRQLASPLRGHGGAIDGLQFGSDGATLFSSGGDGEVRAWDGLFWHSRADVRERVCRIVGTDLSRAEWALYVTDVKFVERCR